MYRHYTIVIHKDSDSDYCVTVPDLPGCITAGDTVEDAQDQAVEAIQCHIEGMLLDGEFVPEAKEIAFHQDNPDYADGVWKSITIVLPDISEIRVSRPGRIQKFFPTMLIALYDFYFFLPINLRTSARGIQF